ncbi:hypothetical protein Moror_8930 [Moniliophthora roreri MCA 2997]|uniref:Uncharacterized protein n=2 Tax=Moniliophthora roreri TaxID=221103 RepID=V2XH29_MONRO|nr:hypothetical protein Moror_8930 [Moniliophthora roreri MCA 2997]
MSTHEALLSPTLTATSTSSFDVIEDPRSRSSTISNLSTGEDSDDEIVWQVSPTRCSAPDASATEESDDDFVVLSRQPRSPRSDTLNTVPNSPPNPSALTTELGKLSLRSTDDVSTKGTVPVATTTSTDTRSSSPSTGSERSISSKGSQRRTRRKARRNAGESGLGARPIVDDVSEAASDNGDHEATQISAYEEAVQFVNMFLTNPDAYNNSSGRLTLLQSIIIELGLAKSAIPASMKSAKALLKSHAFVNIREYIAVREQGMEAIQQIMHPSRSALARSIKKSPKNRASLPWVKEHGLQVLLVSCFYH